MGWFGLGSRSVLMLVVGFVAPGLWSGIGMTVTLLVAFRQVSEKRPKPGKPVGVVHVMFDDIKREVVEPTKTPDRDGEHHGSFDRRMLHEKQGRGEQTDE